MLALPLPIRYGGPVFVPEGRGGFRAMSRLSEEFSLPVRIQAPEHSVPAYFSNGTERRARLNIANLLMKKWSGRVDSNHRPLGPEPSALPD
jgi:hypothetical protein